jgi:hypothetical protein
MAGMDINISDDEKLHLAALLKRSIRDDPYPLSPRVRTLQAILDKIEPPRVAEPIPPPKHYAPPRTIGGRRRR